MLNNTVTYLSRFYTMHRAHTTNRQSVVHCVIYCCYLSLSFHKTHKAHTRNLQSVIVLSITVTYLSHSTQYTGLIPAICKVLLFYLLLLLISLIPHNIQDSYQQSAKCYYFIYYCYLSLSFNTTHRTHTSNLQSVIVLSIIVAYFSHSTQHTGLIPAICKSVIFLFITVCLSLLFHTTQRAHSTNLATVIQLCYLLVLLTKSIIFW